MSNSNVSYLYLDAQGGQKGPFPLKVLATLLQKHIINGNTIIWKDGMEEWKPVRECEEFKEIIGVLEKQWMYMDIQQQQHGPIVAQQLLHRLSEGELDGMTMVWSDALPAWQPLSEVLGFRALMQLAAPEEEEEEVEAAAAPAFDESQVFAGLEGVAAETERYVSTRAAAAAAGKQRYTADDGTRFVLDAATGEWQETQEEFSESEEEDGESEEAWRKKRREKQEKMKEERKLEKQKKKEAKMKVKFADHESGAGKEGEGEGGGKEEEEEEEEGGPQGGEEKEGHGGGKGNGVGATKNGGEGQQPKRRRKGSRKKRGLAWNDRAANNWVYVTGLPLDAEMDEIKKHFSQCGVLASDPRTQAPKVKLYRDPGTGRPKGDASVCYAKPESVDLAVEVLDGGLLRPGAALAVKRAEFKQKGEAYDPAKRQKLNSKQVLIAKQAQENALSWHEGDDAGGGGRGGAGGGGRFKLTIVVLKGLFDPAALRADPALLQDLEEDLALECGRLGEIKKITCFENNPQGVVVIKYKTSAAAQECVKLMDGRWYGGRKVQCTYWDGVTNFLVTAAAAADGGEKEEEEEKKRLDEFGDWLETQELPDEFKIQVAGGDSSSSGSDEEDGGGDDNNNNNNNNDNDDDDGDEEKC